MMCCSNDAGLAGSAGTMRSMVRVSTAITPMGIPPSRDGPYQRPLFAPTTQRFLEGTFVEESAKPLRRSLILFSLDEPTRIVWALRRCIANVTVPAVGGFTNRDGAVLDIRNVGHPLQNLGSTLEIAAGCKVRNAVLEHDLGTTELQVRGINLSAKHFVECSGTGENNRLTLDLGRHALQDGQDRRRYQRNGR